MPSKTAKDLKEWNEQNPTQKSFIRIENKGNTISIYFCDQEGNELTAMRSFMSGEESRPHGKIYAGKIKKSDGFGDCLGAYTIKETFQTLHGWGPLLYDCVITVAGENGVTPDRSKVTVDATNVWKVYFTSRKNDVRSEQLDVDGTLTPNDPFDDCKSLHSIYSDNPELVKGSPVLDIINRVYYDNGIPTITELTNMDLLYPPKKSNLQELKQIYNSFVNKIKLYN